MHLLKTIILTLIISGVCSGQNLSLNDPSPVYLTGIDYNLDFATTDGLSTSDSVSVYKDRSFWKKIPLSFSQDKDPKIISARVRFEESGPYRFTLGSNGDDLDLRVIPGWLSILPALAAIILALVTRQVLIALFAGVWLGAVFIYSYNPFLGFLHALTGYIGKALAEPDRVAILIFSLTLGGMVGVISKSGGTQGIVEWLSRFAYNSRRGQLATWFMGILIFFDDYANTLIVGNTMRPLTDKLKISREKLSYLVDSTAAPVANIAIISTWIGYELSLINDSFREIGLNQNAYIVFFKTIPFNFYPLLTLFFGFMVAFTGRDLFSMYRAEKRAAKTGAVLRKGSVPLADLSNSELIAKKGAPLRWYNALIPVSIVIITTLSGLWLTGLYATENTALLYKESSFILYASTIIGNSDSFAVLIWASFIGSFTAMILAIAQRILSMNEAVLAWVGGIKAMVMAALILTMAWAIGNMCSDLQTAGYVTSIMKDILSPRFLPVFSFIIAGVIAFSTGTSWGTMAILTPIIIPMAYHLPLSDPGISEAARSGIFLSSIASILAGATFGDHCSPISDTTIMSSMASGADHIDHVRTQLPYALVTAGVSIAFGYLLVGYGAPGWMLLLLCMLVIALIVRFGGKKVHQK